MIEYIFVFTTAFFISALWYMVLNLNTKIDRVLAACLEHAQLVQRELRQHHNRLTVLELPDLTQESTLKNDT